jgi:hypothetical protein
MDYFERVGWDEEWCETAKEIIRTEFEHVYTGDDNGDDDEDAQASHSYVSYPPN